MGTLSDALRGLREFKQDSEIKKCIVLSKNISLDKEKAELAGAVVFFQTSKQQTWLVCTHERLYCILDDRIKDEPHINWSMRKSELVTNNEVTLDIRTHDKSAETGLIDLGPKHTGWLYSKRSFLYRGIEDSVRDLISSQMIE